MAELFGWQISRKEEKEPVSFTGRDQDDGSILVDVDASKVFGHFEIAIDFETNVISEIDTINKYRDIAQIPEVDYAIDDIINEMVSIEENEPVTIDLSNVKNISENIKDKFREEFENMLDKLKFSENGYELIKKWYIDGRIYLNVIIDKDNYKNEGIKDILYVDPRKIKKIREMKSDEERGISVKSIKDEYYVYSDDGFKNSTPSNSMNQGVKISKDAICSLTSGITSKDGSMVLSHLHKAIRPINQLRNLEDSSIIYRLARAPERRIFYIEVGNLPKSKQEQYIQEVMNQYKSKMVYNTQDGTVKDTNRHMTMSEDYYLPRRGDGKATEISTLPGGQNLGEMEEITYFKQNFLRALNVPITRLDPNAGFQLGRASEIARDEVKFSKFIGRLRKRFSKILLELFMKQLILKNLITIDDFDKIKKDIFFNYSSDNTFSELKNAEMLEIRIGLLNQVDPYVGKYYSKQYVEQEVLQLTDEEIDRIKKDIKENPKDHPTDDDQTQNDGMGGPVNSSFRSKFR